MFFKKRFLQLFLKESYLPFLIVRVQKYYCSLQPINYNDFAKEIYLKEKKIFAILVEEDKD